MALAIFVRSIPVALAIGIVWSGPFEHLLEDAWTAAGQWFPGLLLEALAAGGTADVSVDAGAHARRALRRRGRDRRHDRVRPPRRDGVSAVSRTA